MTPPWLTSMRADLGQEEIPGPANNPRIIAKARLPGVKFLDVPGLVAYGNEYTSDDKQAWCGAECGGCVAECGLLPPFNRAVDTQSYLWAAAWRTWGVKCELRVGAIACYDGHVNMVDEIIDANTFWGIGGNQGSPNGGAVTRSKRQVSSVVALRWPSDDALAAAHLSQFSLSAKEGDVPTTISRPELKLGATGGFVTELQKLLGLNPTGSFDGATDAAVRAFQRQHGLDVDGEVGTNTWGALLGGKVTLVGNVPHEAEYLAQWASMVPEVEHAGEIDETARSILSNKARYQAVVAGTGVPWFFVACIHSRESSCDFTKNIHNGQSLHQVTTLAPTGRGPFASFEASVLDWIALKGLASVPAWTVAVFAYRSEINNGLGYRNHGVPSAYLWALSSVYLGGKYIADGPSGWSPTTRDTQIGVMPLLKRLMVLDATIVLGSKALDGEVMPPIDTDTKPPTTTVNPLPLLAIVGIILFLINRSEKPMANETAGQGLDLSKLLANLPKYIAIFNSPQVQKALSGKPLSLQDIADLAQTVMPLIAGTTLLPPPVKTDPPPVGPVTPTPVTPTPETQPGLGNPIAKTSIWALGAGLFAQLFGIIAPPVGETSTTAGTLTTFIPLVAGAISALGGFGPIVKIGLQLAGAWAQSKKPTAAILFTFLLAGMLCTVVPATAGSNPLDETVRSVKQRLWPRYYAVVQPPAPPIVKPPEVVLPPPYIPKTAPFPEPVAPPKAAPPIVRQIKPLPPIAEPAPIIKPERRKVTRTPAPQAAAGADLPYSCTQVRIAAAIYSRAELEAMGRERGITRKQRRQAQACLTG